MQVAFEVQAKVGLTNDVSEFVGPPGTRNFPRILEGAGNCELPDKCGTGLRIGLPDLIPRAGTLRGLEWIDQLGCVIHGKCPI